MRCRKCGEYIDDSGVFACPACGEPLKASQFQQPPAPPVKKCRCAWLGILGAVVFFGGIGGAYLLDAACKSVSYEAEHNMAVVCGILGALLMAIGWSK